MSEKKKSGDQGNDAELDDLLNSALEDFNKISQPVKNEDAPGLATTTYINPPEDGLDEWTQDFIKNAAERIDKKLQILMKRQGIDGPEDEDDVGGSLQQMAQTVANAISADSPPDSEGNEFQTAIAQALKDISATSETLQNAAPGITEADLTAMFGQTSLDESGDGILPMMQAMMQSLLTKEILYPSLKELVDQYPTWLDQKKDSLSQEDLTRFTKQFGLMQQVCGELEKEKEDDSEATKKAQFNKILGLMQEMQNCGQPPEDLIGDQTNLFDFDKDGNPLIGQSFPPGVDPKNCSIILS
ncbi:peroxisomal biogenesis factor 19 [Diachasmimorpha longicaudata]|uniref:peroxisomal biogenesis factor 19 n=1 Tax=Diachasmimorpha longicaudata TaxID=58733 RepID=UPI0030B87351